MAYIYHQSPPLTLNIIDLQTSATQSFILDEKYINGGQYTWSQDGTKLFFMLESQTNGDHFISMIFLDLSKNNSMVTFIKNKDFAWISSKIEVTDNEIKIIPLIGSEPLFYNITTGF